MADFEMLIKFLPVLWTGTLITLKLCSLSLLIGSIVGLIVGLMRSSRHRLLRWPATLYVEIFRSIPLLLLLFFVYYGLPLVLAIDIPSYPAAVTGLSLYCGAYMAEVVRTGLEAVAKGQWEASYSLGLRYLATLRYVILPQALRVALPPAINVYIATFKDSSVASVIGFFELTGSGLAIRESSFGANTAGILFAVAAIYFVIAYSLSICGQALERRIRI